MALTQECAELLARLQYFGNLGLAPTDPNLIINTICFNNPIQGDKYDIRNLNMDLDRIKNQLDASGNSAAARGAIAANITQRVRTTATRINARRRQSHLDVAPIDYGSSEEPSNWWKWLLGGLAAAGLTGTYFYVSRKRGSK